MIVYQSKNIEEIGARIEWTHFTAGEVEEVHAMLHVEPRCELFEGQMTRIQQAEKIFLEMEDVQGSSIVFKRYFLSDATNQVPVIQERDACTVSYIPSTGIGGSPYDPKALVQLDSYAMTGFEPQQQRYLYGLSHLNRTIEYGVTFEPHWLPSAVLHGLSRWSVWQ